MSCVASSLHKLRDNRRLVVVLVFLTVFIDCTLLTVVAPILPNLIASLEKHSTDISSRDTDASIQNFSTKSDIMTQNNILNNNSCCNISRSVFNLFLKETYFKKEFLHNIIHEASIEENLYSNNTITAISIMCLNTSLNKNHYNTHIFREYFIKCKCTSLEESKNYKEFLHNTSMLCGNGSLSVNIKQSPSKKNITQLCLRLRLGETLESAAEPPPRGNEPSGQKLGLLFGSKAIVQLLATPFVGPITNRLGFYIPMALGLLVMFVTTVVFALAKSYELLFVARAVQGLGSAATRVSSMAMLATVFPDEVERGKVIAIALSGIGLGMITGPTYGGVMFDFAGQTATFLVLAGVVFLAASLQVLVLRPSVRGEVQPSTPYRELLADPYMLVVAGAITLANLSYAALEPAVPLRMVEIMNSPIWEQGIVFLPVTAVYLITSTVVGHLGHRYGRWAVAAVGLVLNAGGCVATPFAQTFLHFTLAFAALGVAIGLIDAAMLPHVAYLVDLRHSRVYGSAFAISDVGYCAGFALGPYVGMILMEHVGFEWMVWTVAMVNVAFVPAMLLLRNPPARREEELCLTKTSNSNGVTVPYSNTGSVPQERGNSK